MTVIYAAPAPAQTDDDDIPVLAPHRTASATTTGVITNEGPPKTGLDYYCDGIVGDSASDGTAGEWD